MYLITKFKAFFTRNRQNEIDMTVGSITENIIRFALPLMIGNLFQQLYNMVDTWVIGQTGDVGAYGAVGSVGPIINILIGFFSGLASGAGVVISQYYGSKNNKKVHDTVHASIFITIVLSVAFTVIGVVGTPFVLQLMLKSDGNMESIFPHAKTYLSIYFSGITALLVYNMGAGILRAVGDSKRPFYYLVVAAVLNVTLDLLFVNQFNMGVAGVALATVISQAISALLVVLTLLRTETVVKLRLRDIRNYSGVTGAIIRLGFPAALQMSLTAFSNVFVQSYISNVNEAAALTADSENYCLAGWTTYSKIDQFIFLPVQSISLAVTTFVGQNLGGGDRQRAKKGVRVSFLLSLAVTLVVIALVLLFTPPLSKLFNDDPNVVFYAKKLLYHLTPFYMFCCVNQVFNAALRGGGNTRAPMLIMLLSFVGFRQLYLYVVSEFISNDLLPVAFGYPAGWFVCCVTTLIYYKLSGLDKGKLVTD